MPRFSLERSSFDGLSSFKRPAYQSPAGVLKKDTRGALGVSREGGGTSEPKVPRVRGAYPFS